MGYNVEKIRREFPFFNNQKTVYFDNACMSLRPKSVINAVVEYYSQYPGCAGRSVHKISTRVSEEVENARKKIAKFFGTKKKEEIIFTRNTTEGINLISNSFKFKEGDSVLISDKEHNSNLLPWQYNKKIKRVILNSKIDNLFDMGAYEQILERENIRLVSLVHTSNIDGVSIPAKEIIKKAHDKGALVLLDAAQSAPHKEIDVRELDVDFLACSGHKMLGPSGTGILYGKKELLEELNQFLVGGETVIDTTYDSHKLEALPHRFEAGLQHYAGMIGLGEAVKFLRKIGLKNIEKHENKLNRFITEEIGKHPKIRLIGPEDYEKRSGIFSFNISDMTPHSIALMLDSGYNICIRSGAHCVHSWFNKHNLPGSARASLYLYNTISECEKFVDAVRKAGNL